VYARLEEEGFADVRPAHSAVLRNITSEGSRIIDLADRAGITKQSMGALVATLEKRGYVEVRRDPEDARARRVLITRRGRALQETALRVTAEAEKEMAERFGAAEFAYLRLLLERLNDALERVSEA
jgi:DNA-binding MarR family transcriptional regulator